MNSQIYQFFLILQDIIFKIMISNKAIESFKSIETPFYYYDIDLLRETLSRYTSLINKYNYKAHYALKANAEPNILKEIVNAGLGDRKSVV